MRPQHAHGVPGGGLGCILCNARSVACSSTLQALQDEWWYCFIRVTVVTGYSDSSFQAPHVVQDFAIYVSRDTPRVQYDASHDLYQIR